MGRQHQRVDWPRLPYREQFKEEDEEADRGNDGKTASKSGLAKTALQGTVQGGRRRGRQRKRWEDSIKEWTGQDCPTGNSSRREGRRADRGNDGKTASKSGLAKTALQGTVQGGRRRRQTEETMGRQHQRVDWPRLPYREQFKEGDEEADRGNDGKTASKSGLAKTALQEQFKEGDEEADRGNDGKTTSKSGLTLNGISYYGKPRTARSAESWL